MLLVQYGVFCTFFILNIIENSHGIQHTMLQNPKNPRSPISANKLNSNFLKMTRANVFQTSCTHMIWSKLLIPMFLQKFVLQIFPNKTSFFNILFFCLQWRPYMWEKHCTSFNRLVWRTNFFYYYRYFTPLRIFSIAFISHWGYVHEMFLVILCSGRNPKDCKLGDTYQNTSKYLDIQ